MGGLDLIGFLLRLADLTCPNRELTLGLVQQTGALHLDRG